MTIGFAPGRLVSEIPDLLRHARKALGARLAPRAGPSAVLEGLSPSARALMRRLMAETTHRLRAESLPGAAIGLELRDLIAIHREGGPGPGGRFVLAVNGWALEELRRHPELLAG